MTMDWNDVIDVASTVGRALSDVAEGIEEVATGRRKQRLSDAVATLRLVYDDLQAAQNIVKHADDSYSVVVTQAKQEAASLVTAVTFEPDDWFTDLAGAAKTLKTALGAANKVNAVIQGVTVLRESMSGLTTAMILSRLRLGSSEALRIVQIEMPLMGQSLRALGTATVAEPAAVAFSFTRALRVMGKIAMGLGSILVVIEIVLNAKSVAHLRGQLASVTTKLAELKALLPQLQESMSELGEAYAELGSRFGSLEDGKYVFRGRDGKTVAISDLVANLARIPVLIAQQGAVDNKAFVELHINIVAQVNIVRDTMAQQSAARVTEAQLFQKLLSLAARMFRRNAGTSLADVADITGLPEDIVAMVRQFATVTVTDGKAVPILQVANDGGLRVVAQTAKEA